MTLEQFTAAVNALQQQRVDKLNLEHAQGKRLFGAMHHSYPETMMRHYYIKGVTPERAYTEILED